MRFNGKNTVNWLQYQSDTIKRETGFKMRFTGI